MYSLKNLLEELDIIENNTLNNNILNIPLIKDNLIMYLNKYISYHIRHMSSSDIKSNMNKADDFYYDLLEEELEERNRRDSYTSSYSSSWGSSSSSSGGFSGGGGGSTGGGGAGRSF